MNSLVFKSSVSFYMSILCELVCMYAMTIGVCVCVCVQAFRSVFVMSVQAISVPLSCVYKHSMCFMRV